jgi:hypothetical protein
MFTQAITLFQQYNMLDELKKAQDDLKKIQ